MAPNNPRVTVIMPTYNGIKYLSQQIDSILNQVDVEVSLWVRDDGSTDGTVEFLESLGDSITFLKDDLGNLGTAGNLIQLIDNIESVDYLATADQDDVWSPEHLKEAVQTLVVDKPALYFPRYKIIDEHGNYVRDLPIKKKLGIQNALVQNQVIGCGIVINGKSFDLIKSINLRSDFYIDWQLYFLHASLDSLVQGSNFGVFYRIHTENSVGVRSRKSIKRTIKSGNILRNYSFAIDVFSDLFMQIEENVSNTNKTIIEKFLYQAREGIFRRVRYSLKPEFRRSTTFDQSVFRVLNVLVTKN